MRHLNHLPIWRDANRLLLAIEQAVRQFPRDHKYTLGSDLRRQAMTVCRLILRAADKGEDQLARVARVVDAVDDLKLQIQLGKELQAFQPKKSSQLPAASLQRWQISDLAVSFADQRLTRWVGIEWRKGVPRQGFKLEAGGWQLFLG